MDYSIAESYTLPSHGKIYATPITPEVKIRSMTTIEEMKRLSKSERPYKNMAEIIDDCLIEKPEISAYDMCIGDYQFLLHKLRIVTYGADYPLASTCPFCGHVNTDTINLEDLRVLEYSPELEKYREFDLPKSGRHIKIKVQTPRILDNITVQSRERSRQSKSSGDFTYLYTLMNIIDIVDDVKLDPIQKEDFVSKMAMADANMIIQSANKLNTSIGLDTELINVCDECGLTYTNSFRITGEFFGPRIYV